jgi:serine/threonine-protein kinase
MSDPITRLNAALEGRYSIERELGQGGMATVYLADDLKHERKVALKVLKPELAAVVGAERFLAEIKTTANLQHPHILPLFDSGEADGFLFYVMPFVEGESLRDRLDREHQLPVDESVRIATDVAEALHAAHEQGVIHRDIKPANILMSRGRPLIADFGIALAVSAAGGGRMTETGLSLGTPHYMSPEQATGEQSVGPTTDIYALGCVLYELLVGEPPYTGGTAQAILGKIIAGELASATKQRATVPAHLDAAIRKALEKVPADRFANAQDLARALADPGFRHGEYAGGVGAGAAGAGPWNRLSIGATGLAALFMLIAGWGWLRPTPSPPPASPLLSSLVFPPDSAPAPAQGFALSPDETQLAFVSQARLDGGRIWIRSLATGRQSPLEGTDRGGAPAWSPKGDRIAYRAGGEIKVVPAAGGPITTVAAFSGGVGMPAWMPDGRLVFLGPDGIMTASEGRAPELVFPMDQPPLGHGVIEPLPDGRRFLFGRLGPRRTPLLFGDFVTLEQDTVIDGAGAPHYSDGWLAFYRQNGPLVVQRFDPESGRLEGTATAVVDRIPTPGGRLQANVGDRTIVFAPRSEDETARLVWTDRSGGAGVPLAEASVSEEGWQRALSPDGTRIAFGGWGLWVVDVGGGLPRRIEGAGNLALAARWSDDASSILYRGAGGLNKIGMNPGDSPVVIRPSEASVTVQPVGWGADGEVLFIENRADGSSALRAVDGDGTGGVRTVQPGATWAALSPDKRWLAYVSEQGRDESEVFVRAYPGSEEARISPDGGLRPTWGPEGDEVYFVTRRGQAWRVSLSFAGGLRPSPPELLPFDGGVDNVWAHPDGRLLFDMQGGGTGRLEVLRDWKTAAGAGGGE